MGLLIKVLKDSDTKPQYEVTLEVDPGAISVSDGQIAMFFGSELNAHRVSADSSGRKNMQALREVGWPNPGLGLVNMAAMKWTESIPTVALGSAGVPALDESYVALILGADFTVSGNSNSAHCHRMLENFAGSVQEAPDFSLMTISGTAPGLLTSIIDLTFAAGAMNANVDWGDESGIENITTGGVTSHTFPTTGFEYTITITGQITTLDMAATEASGNQGSQIDMRFLGWGDVTYDSLADMHADWIDNSNKYLGLGAPDLTGVTDLSSCFEGSSGVFGQSAATEAFADWDVSPVLDFSRMFADTGPNTGGLVNLSGWVFASAADVTDMFNGCDMNGLNMSGAVFPASMNSMFAQATNNSGGWNFENADWSAVTNYQSLFTQFTAVTGSLSTINLDGITPSAGDVASTASMFSNMGFSGNLTMPAITQAAGSFGSTFSTLNLANGGILDVSALNFSSTFNSTNLFNSCTAGGVITTGAFFSTTGSLAGLFNNSNIPGFVDANAAIFDVPLCTAISNAFSNTDFSSIDVTGWTFVNISNPFWNNWFNDSPNLTTIIGIDAWDVSLCDVFSEFFLNCSSLTGIDFSGWTLTSVNNNPFQSMFNGCTALDSASTDSFVEACYNARLTMTGTAITLFLDDTQGLSGIYQDDPTPSTGLEWAFKLNNNPDVEAFTPWTITDQNIP